MRLKSIRHIAAVGAMGLILAGCGQDNTGVETIRLEAERVVECSDEILSIQALSPYGDSEIITFTTADVPFGNVVSLSDGSVKASFGKKGEGPGENFWPRVIGVITPKHKVGLVDLSLGKLSVVTLGDSATTTEYNIAPHGTANLGVMLSDTTFMLHYMGEEKRFALICKDKLVADTIIPYPGGEDISPMQAALIYQGGMLRHPSDNKLVHFSKYGKLFELFDFSEGGKQINRYKVVVEEQPAYWKNGESTEMVSGKLRDESTVGFVDGCVTENGIYLLYCGKPMNDKTKYDDITTVEEYDWTGELRHRYELDTPTKNIAVVGHKLIGISENESKYLLKIYPIPED